MVFIVLQKHLWNFNFGLKYSLASLSWNENLLLDTVLFV